MGVFAVVASGCGPKTIVRDGETLGMVPDEDLVTAITEILAHPLIS